MARYRTGQIDEARGLIKKATSLVFTINDAENSDDIREFDTYRAQLSEAVDVVGE